MGFETAHGPFGVVDFRHVRHHVCRMLGAHYLAVKFVIFYFYHHHVARWTVDVFTSLAKSKRLPGCQATNIRLTSL